MLCPSSPDYLDLLSAGNQCQSHDRRPSAPKLLQSRRSGKCTDESNRLDKTHKKSKTVKKRRKQTIASGHVETALEPSLPYQKDVKQLNEDGSNSMENTTKSIFCVDKRAEIPPEFSRRAIELNTCVNEFNSYCAVRLSCIQQLDHFVSVFLSTSSKIRLQLKDALAGEFLLERMGSQKDQFLMLILNLRKNSVEVIQCYQKALSSYSLDTTDLVDVILKKMRKKIKEIAEYIFPYLSCDPFTSWLVVSPVQNMFFLQKKFDGTSAYSYGVFSSSNKSHFPNELRMTALETEKHKVLGTIVLGIIEQAADEILLESEKNKVKIRDSSVDETNIFHENAEEFLIDDESKEGCGPETHCNGRHIDDEKKCEFITGHNNENQIGLQSVSNMLRFDILKKYMKFWKLGHNYISIMRDMRLISNRKSLRRVSLRSRNIQKL